MERAGAPLQLDLPLRYRRQRLVAQPPRRRNRNRWAQMDLALLVPAEQLLLDLVIEISAAEAWADAMPVHRVVAAVGLEPVATRAARSIFDMAAGMADAEPAELSADAPPYRADKAQVTRAGGTTVHTGRAYPSNRWTPEREEQERARRARQKPPKPAKGARTKSAKLRELIGGG